MVPYRFLRTHAIPCCARRENRFQQVKTAAKRTGNLPNKNKVSQGKAALKELLNHKDQ